VGIPWPGEGGADYAVNFHEFFTPGTFALQNLFTTELGGTAPTLFKIQWYQKTTDTYPFYENVFTGSSAPVTAPIAGDGSETNVAESGYGAPYGVYGASAKHIPQRF